MPYSTKPPDGISTPQHYTHTVLRLSGCTNPEMLSLKFLVRVFALAWQAKQLKTTTAEGCDPGKTVVVVLVMIDWLVG